jgi:broad specificity phosphatase PhoE
VQTTLAAFPHILDNSNYIDGSSVGIDDGAKLIVDPDLQERSDLPCDTGSDRTTLETTFPGVNFGILEQDWYVKDGAYSADDGVVEARAARSRTRLAQLLDQLKDEQKKDIVVVTHGAFMKVLTGDPDIDLPKAGWRSYNVIYDAVGGHTTLVPVV